MPNYNDRFGNMNDDNDVNDVNDVNDRNYRTEYRNEDRWEGRSENRMDNRQDNRQDSDWRDNMNRNDFRRENRGDNSRIYSSDYGWQNSDRDYDVYRHRSFDDRTNQDRNQNFGSRDNTRDWGRGIMDRVDRAFNRGRDDRSFGNRDDRSWDRSSDMNRGGRDDRNRGNYGFRSRGGDDYNRDYRFYGEDHNMDYQRGHDFGLGMGSDTRSSDLGFGRMFDRGSYEREHSGSQLGYGNDYGRGDLRQGSGSYGFGNSDYDSSYFGTGRAFGSNRNQNRMGGMNAGMNSGLDYGTGSAIDHRGKGPKGYKRSDDRIREEVSDVLERHPDIDASEIEIDVKDGFVVLRGHVEDRRQKRMAEDSIEHLNGVKDVRNELTVNQSLFERAKEFLTGESSNTSGQQSKADPASARH